MDKKGIRAIDMKFVPAKTIVSGSIVFCKQANKLTIALAQKGA
ncbi:hypothetical protein [Acetivibrio cellulolyticus]